VAGLSSTYLLVLGGTFFAAGVAGDGLRDALDVLIDGLHAPEASSGKDGDLGRRAGRGIERGRRYDTRSFGPGRHQSTARGYDNDAHHDNRHRAERFPEHRSMIQTMIHDPPPWQES
jgi:hypothetical protein